MRIILASASPRRAEVLQDAGVPFEVVVTETDESARAGEAVDAMVCRLAEAKARAGVERLGTLAEPAVVIGADTVVELDGEVLGKPGSPEVARAMLEKLSGKTHGVLTALAMIHIADGEEIARIEVQRTEVRFALLTAAEIAEYVTTGEPLDKAGAYGIQGFGGRFVERIDGCYFNVVGLPLARVYRNLVEFGWKPTRS